MSAIRRWQLLPLLWVSIAVALCLPAPSLAQDPHELIKFSLLLVKVEIPPDGEGPRKTYPTNGVLVSDDGLVLTSYKLLTKAKDPLNPKIWVQFNDQPAEEIEATVVAPRVSFDLLLLQMEEVPQPLQRAKLDPYFEIEQNTPIHASWHDTSTQGSLQISPPWDGSLDERVDAGSKFLIADLPFSEGQIGSPVYNDAGHVLGIMSGDPEGSQQAIIPIKYADPLIAHVRLHDMVATIDGIRERLPDSFSAVDLEHKVRKLEEFIGVLRTYEWSYHADPDNKAFAVTFEREIGGEPRLSTVTVHVQPYARSRTPVTPVQTTVSLLPSNNDLRGEVDLPDVFTRITNFEASTPDKILNATIDVQGTYGDNTLTPRVSLCYKIEKTSECPEQE